MPVQINGKVRGRIVISKTATQDEVIDIAKQNTDVSKSLDGAAIKKVIYVPTRILNIII